MRDNPTRRAHTTYQEARDAMRDNFFGVGELQEKANKDCFADTDYERIRTVPFPLWRLERHRETHMLVLYHPSYITGLPPIDGFCWCLVPKSRFDAERLRLDFAAPKAQLAA